MGEPPAPLGVRVSMGTRSRVRSGVRIRFGVRVTVRSSVLVAVCH